MIKAEEFQTAFFNWVKEIAKLSAGEIISLDGKHLRGSKKKEQTINEGLRLVSA